MAAGNRHIIRLLWQFSKIRWQKVMTFGE